MEDFFLFPADFFFFFPQLNEDILRCVFSYRNPASDLLKLLRSVDWYLEVLVTSHSLFLQKCFVLSSLLSWNFINLCMIPYYIVPYILDFLNCFTFYFSLCFSLNNSCWSVFKFTDCFLCCVLSMTSPFDTLLFILSTPVFEKLVFKCELRKIVSILLLKFSVCVHDFYWIL